MIVFDTSALVDIAIGSEEGHVLKDFVLEGEKTISCDLIQAELANVFRRFTRTDGLAPELAEAFFEKSLKLVDEFYPIEDLQSEAFRESIRLNHSTYDMFYFVLARRTGGTLFTTDRKLMKLCLGNGVNCVTQLDWDAEDFGLS